jgi:hypothetical protein
MRLMRHTHGHRDEVKEKGRRARAYILEHFSLEKVGRVLVDEFARIERILEARAASLLTESESEVEAVTETETETETESTTDLESGMETETEGGREGKLEAVSAADTAANPKRRPQPSQQKKKNKKKQKKWKQSSMSRRQDGELR